MLRKHVCEPDSWHFDIPVVAACECLPASNHLRVQGTPDGEIRDPEAHRATALGDGGGDDVQPAARHLASECLAGDPDQIRVRFDGHNLVAVGEKSCSVLAGVHADVDLGLATDDWVELAFGGQ